MVPDSEMLEIFLEEAEELLRQAETGLLELEKEEDGSSINDVFRSFHTLKSSAAMVGFDKIAGYAHFLETILGRISENKLLVTRRLITDLLHSVDTIRSAIKSVEENSEEPGEDFFGPARARLNRFLGLDEAKLDVDKVRKDEAEPGQEGEPRIFHVKMELAPDLFFRGQDPVYILKSLSENGELLEVHADLRSLPPWDEYDVYRLYISFDLLIKTFMPEGELEQHFSFLTDDNKIDIKDVTFRFKEGIDLELAHLTLGEILLESGKVSEENLREALQEQKPVGEILIEKDAARKEEIDKAVALQEKSRDVLRKTTLRVDSEKIGALIDLAEEIGIEITKIKTLLIKDSPRKDFEEAVDMLDKLNRDFQEKVSSIRMFSLAGTFRRFERLARDLAWEKKKTIEVISEGTETELDKEIIEGITGPMKHIIRNAIDHGIELPQERLSKGKPEKGRIIIRANQRGGFVFLDIIDDGKGVDFELVRKKARAKGLLKDGNPVDEKRLISRLFLPGFSTKDDVSELSGRGVGLDAAAEDIKRLGGEIFFETEKDKGTRVTLKLPLKTALLEALRISTQIGEFMLPMEAITRVVPFDVQRIKDVDENHSLFYFEGQYLPVFYIENVFGGKGDWKAQAKSRSMVVLGSDERRFAVPATEVLEAEQIIIKTLEKNFKTVDGIIGACILGDGDVRFVLDPAGLGDEVFHR